MDRVSGVACIRRVWPVSKSGNVVVKATIKNISTPLTNIPVHIVKTELDRLLRAHVVVHTTTVFRVPPHVTQKAATGVDPTDDNLRCR